MELRHGRAGARRRFGLAVAAVATAVASLPLAITGSGTAAADEPLPTERFTLPRAQQNEWFSPAAGQGQRPLLVVYQTFGDVPDGDTITEAAIARRFFGSQEPGFRSLVEESSEGRFAFVPAAETSGIANNGVIVVPYASSPTPAPGEGADPYQVRLTIEPINAIPDAVIDYSRFDVRDGNGNPAPDGDGVVDRRELAIQVVRETTCTDAQLASADGCSENGGVAQPGAVPADQDDITFDLNAALTTIRTNALTHLHELLHASFAVYQDYERDDYDLTDGTINGGFTPRVPNGAPVVNQTWETASAWTRFRLGWVEPRLVATSGRYRLEPGGALAVRDANNSDRYALVEVRTNGPDPDLRDNSPGVVVWAADESRQGVGRPAGWQQFVPAVGPAAGNQHFPFTWVDGTAPSFAISDTRRAADGTWSVDITLDGSRRARMAIQPGLFGRFSRGQALLPVTVFNYGARAPFTVTAFGGTTTRTLDPGQQEQIGLGVPFGSGTSVDDIVLSSNGVELDRISLTNYQFPATAEDVADNPPDPATARQTTFPAAPSGWDSTFFHRLAATSSTATFETTVDGAFTTYGDVDHLQMVLPRLSQVDQRLGTAEACGTTSVQLANGSTAQATVSTRLIVEFETPYMREDKDRAFRVPGYHGGASRTTEEGDRLTYECVGAERQDPLLVRVGSVSGRFNALGYSVRVRYEVHVERLPSESSLWLDPVIAQDEQAINSIACPSGRRVPFCLGNGPSLFEVEHPIAPSRGNNCLADGCPDYVPFAWPGGVLSLMAHTPSPLELGLLTADGQPFVDARLLTGVIHDTTTIPCGALFPCPANRPPSGPLETGRVRTDFMLDDFNYLLETPLEAGNYFLRIAGEPTSYTFDVLGDFDIDLDGLADVDDTCMAVFNPRGEDADGDGIGGLCDGTPGPFLARPIAGEGAPPQLPEAPGEGFVEVRLDRPNFTGTALQLRVDTAGTATRGVDYHLPQSVVEVPPGSDTALIPFSVLADTTGEDDGRNDGQRGETMVLGVAPVTPGEAQQNGPSVTVVLLDDDPMQRPTTLTARPALYAQLPFGPIYLLPPGVSAQLTTTGGAPVAGEQIIYRAGTTELCRATTGPDGTAACNPSLLGVLAMVVNLGYTATHNPTTAWGPSTARGTLARIGLRL